MNKKLATILLAVLSLASLATYTEAAVPTAKAKETKISSDSNHYYVRADIGYGFTKMKVHQEALDTYFNETIEKTIINKTGSGLLGSLGAGYYATKNIRLEGQLYFDDGIKAKGSSSTRNVLYSVRVKEKTVAGFLNAYYDFTNSTKLTPYLMGGIGIAKNKIKYSNADSDLHTSTISGPIEFKSKNEFAYQFGLGASYRLIPNLDFDLGYRLMQKGRNKRSANTIRDSEVSFTYNTKAKLSISQTLLAGIRYTF